jgi:hypothetical protein
MRKTKTKTKTKTKNNRKRSINYLRKSKRRGRGIGASKISSARFETVFDDGGVGVNFHVDWDEEEAKKEYKWRLDHALTFNKDIIGMRDSALIRLNNKALKNDRSMNSQEDKEELSTKISSRIAELVQDRKYAEFAKNYNINLLQRFASQQSIDYEGLLAAFNTNPDFSILRMAPTYDKWKQEYA